MKKLFSILILLLVFIAVIRVPGLQAEDWGGQSISSSPGYSLQEGIPDFPILCLEGLSAKQLDDVRGGYTTGVALLPTNAPEGENRIILWDEPNRTAAPPMSPANLNNQSSSTLTVVGYK
jgi:hypothetical protein